MDVLVCELMPGDRLECGSPVLTLYESGGLVAVETPFHTIYWPPDQVVRIKT